MDVYEVSFSILKSFLNEQKTGTPITYIFLNFGTFKERKLLTYYFAENTACMLLFGLVGSLNSGPGWPIGRMKTPRWSTMLRIIRLLKYDELCSKFSFKKRAKALMIA